MNVGEEVSAAARTWPGRVTPVTAVTNCRVTAAAVRAARPCRRFVGDSFSDESPAATGRQQGTNSLAGSHVMPAFCEWASRLCDSRGNGPCRALY